MANNILNRESEGIEKIINYPIIFQRVLNDLTYHCNNKNKERDIAIIFNFFRPDICEPNGKTNFSKLGVKFGLSSAMIRRIVRGARELIIRWKELRFGK